MHTAARVLLRVSRLTAQWALPAASGALLALLAYVAFAPLPPIDERARSGGAVVLDREGAVLYRESADGLHIPIGLEDVAPIAVAATVAAEDQRFWQHPGVDPLAVVRAAASLPSIRSGASTITQQLARALYLDASDPLPLRKPREALLALQLEAHYSKDEILQAYLNEVYYGRGAYGIEAAARAYFGVPARELDLAQASLLAGLPQRPGLDPLVHPEGARARQAYVLGRLEADGVISAAQAAEAATVDLAVLPPERESLAPHFVGYVFDELRTLRPDLAARDDLIIETTLDSDLQRESQRAVRARLPLLEDREASSAAVVVLDPSNGSVLAMVGSADFSGGAAGQINMAVEPRQPGSALKPFLYAAAFERGYTPATMVLDVPSRFDTPLGLYEPVNFDLRFRGPVPVRVALASSLNVPAVRTLDEIGEEALLEIAHRFGLDSLGAAEAYGLSLILGAGEVPLLELTAAYGALAARGILAEPYAIERVLDGRGEVLYERRPQLGTEVLAPELAYLLTDILSDPIARIPGFGGYSVLDTPLDAAVKTGSSSRFRDSWTVGFTPDRVVGVWVGNPDGAPMRDVSGTRGAAPIWRTVIEAASAGIPRRPFVAPPGVVAADVCHPTGLRPGPHCTVVESELFVAGTEPSAIETYYQLDSSGRLQLDPPAAARAWALDAGLSVVGDASLDTRAQADGVRIVSPGPGAVLYLAPELDAQEAVLRASAPAGASRVEFVIDGITVGAIGAADPRLIWPLVVGVHDLEVVARLANGSTRSARIRFEVRAP